MKSKYLGNNKAVEEWQKVLDDLYAVNPSKIECYDCPLYYGFLHHRSGVDDECDIIIGELKTDDCHRILSVKKAEVEQRICEQILLDGEEG